MSCDQHQDRMLLSVVGTLDPDEERSLRAHLAEGCPQCNGAMAEAEAIVGSMALALPEVPPPEGVRGRLLNRVRAEVRPSSPNAAVSLPEKSIPLPTSARGDREFAEWTAGVPAWSRAAVAALLLFATAVGGSAVYWHLSKELRTEEAEVARLLEQVNKRKMRNSLLMGEIEKAETLVEAVEVRQLRLVSLTATDAQPSSAWGRILWDTERGRWYFRGMGMNPAAANRTYELWAVDDAEKVPAGTFEVDADGRALLVFDLPASLADVKMAAVTDEPDGGSPQPTGSYQLTGEVP